MTVRTERVVMIRLASVTTGVLVLMLASVPANEAQAPPSDRPDQAFKLAAFEAAGQLRLGMVIGTRVLDLAAASRHVASTAKLPEVAIPGEMKALIEQYATVAPRLYQIANHFKTASMANLPFAFDADKVSFKAPIKYPWNLLAAAANYKLHAE